MSPLFISGLMQGIGLLQGMQVMQPGFQGATHGMCVPELLPGSPPTPHPPLAPSLLPKKETVCGCVRAFVCVCICVCREAEERVRMCGFGYVCGEGGGAVPGITQGVDVQAHQGLKYTADDQILKTKYLRL